jgi:hypothetical protein
MMVDTISEKTGSTQKLDSKGIERKKSRLRVKGIKVSDKDKIKEAIMISVQKGNYTTREIGLDLGVEYHNYCH